MPALTCGSYIYTGAVYWWLSCTKYITNIRNISQRSKWIYFLLNLSVCLSKFIIDWCFSCGLVTPHGDMGLGQHWPKQWIVAWGRIQMTLKISITDMGWKSMGQRCSSTVCVVLERSVATEILPQQPMTVNVSHVLSSLIGLELTKP